MNTTKLVKLINTAGLFLLSALGGYTIGDKFTGASVPGEVTPAYRAEPKTRAAAKISIEGQDVVIYRVDEVEIDGVSYIVVFSPEGVAITRK